MSKIAIASSSQLAADAGAEVARAGGNAVDAAVAASLVSMCTEPGVCALGAVGYVTLWTPGGRPLTIDGYAEMPGRGLPRERLGQGAWAVEMAYGGGLRTFVGPGSVAIPGGVAALGRAWERDGHLPWREVIEPARAISERGFPMPKNSHYYLQYSADCVYGWQPHSAGMLRDPGGEIAAPGSTVRIPGLADSLERIGRLGAQEFYTGELGHYLADFVSDAGGMLTREDMAAYRAIERPSLVVDLDAWEVATTPAPAIGGAALVAMMMLTRKVRASGWSPAAVAHMVEAQRTVIDYRSNVLFASKDVSRDVLALLEAISRDQPPGASGSTVHTSVVDGNGLGCAITMSSGYGSGVLPTDTGVWLNNSLGEIELGSGGLLVEEPGTRLSSNMAPTVARRQDGTVLAIGSPGAERITTAILQTLINFMHFNMSLEDAVAHPRCHVERTPDGYRVAHEPGLAMGECPLPLRPVDHLSMYFGGVAAARWKPDEGFTVAGDPRRHGGTALAG
jgi:gamma-glutamyltranspeptidase/glutathione hydrolase